MSGLHPFAAKLLERDEEIRTHPRWRELRHALIDARRWAEPLTYTAKQAGIDRARLAATDEPMGYWERVTLRALIMLDMPVMQREQAIAEAARFHKDAEQLLHRSGPLPTIDLSKLKI